MAAEKGYQGWTNYETWAVALWIDNEESSYRHWRAQTEDVIEAWPADTDRQVRELREALQAEHEEAQPDLDGVWGDLMNAAMSEVNWYEIAEHMLENV